MASEQQLNKFAELVRGDLTPLQRGTLMALITIDVHARGILKDSIFIFVLIFRKSWIAKKKKKKFLSDGCGAHTCCKVLHKRKRTTDLFKNYNPQYIILIKP